MTQDEEKAYLAEQAGQVHRAESAALEREAMVMLKGIPKFMLSAETKEFFRKLADKLEWTELKKVLK